MVQPGRDSPGKEVKGTSPSPSPKWVFRPTNAKRNMKKSATPHPIKNGGNTKRSACVPLTETGRVRKKIVFEFDELIAGTNGGGSAIAGKDGWSSLPGEREKGRWKRKARPGPFEASTGTFEVVPGVLPLLAGELRFSMGQKDGSARHQPEVVTGTRLEGALPEVNEAVAQGVLRSTRVEAAASAAVLDEDTSSERYGANMLFDPPTLAAPFPEKDRHVLASETCDSLMGQSLLQFKSGDGTNFKAEDNNGGGEAGLNGKPSAPDNPSDPPDKLLDQDRDQPEILPKHSASKVGIDVASPVGSPPTLGHSLEFITDKAAQAETQPVEPDLDEKPANTGAGLDSGGPPKSDAVNLDADHDTEMGTFGWCEGIPSLTFSNEETKCLVDKATDMSSDHDNPSCKSLSFPSCPNDGLEAKGPENHHLAHTPTEGDHMEPVALAILPAGAPDPPSDQGPAVYETTVGEGDAMLTCAGLAERQDGIQLRAGHDGSRGPDNDPDKLRTAQRHLGDPLGQIYPNACSNVDGLAVGPQGDGSSGNHPPNEIIRPMNHTQGRESGAAEKGAWS
ncbi:hypothetical protein SASPL_147167 [Salvia splendens]|uniref:Uncharacterized protein n=1 Tax=Salvia splendens TaxID=180675 RepID=A0A8X8Z693_SALSN|nr:hypothetical protein SASPL_147167 [Salvia splendens]